MSKFGVTPLTSPPKVIVNKCSDGTLAGATFLLSATMAKEIMSGETTANVYKELLAVAASGVIDLCYVRTVDTTSRTVGLKITIDGVDAFSAISAATTTANDGLIGIGLPSRADMGLAGADLKPQPMVFNSSLSISVRSSVAATETDKLALGVSYRTI